MAIILKSTHEHTEHNYCIKLECKEQLFVFVVVVATDNFEEFERNFKHTVKETTLPPDNTTLSYDTEFNGKVDRKADALR